MKFSDFISENQAINELDVKGAFKKAQEKIKKLFGKKEPPKKEEIKKVIEPIKKLQSDNIDYGSLEKDLHNLLKIKDPYKRKQEFKKWDERSNEKGESEYRRQSAERDAGKDSNRWREHNDRMKNMENKATGADKKEAFVYDIVKYIKPKIEKLAKKIPNAKGTYVDYHRDHHYVRMAKGEKMYGGDVRIFVTNEKNSNIDDPKTLEQLKAIVCDKIVKDIIKNNMAYVNRVWIYNNGVHLSVFETDDTK